MAKQTRPDDLIAMYIEWTQHRYDPGYYLGGTIVPHLRKASLGPRARRLAGLLLGVMALIAAGAAAMSLIWGSGWGAMPEIAWFLLIGSAAITMYRSSAKQSYSDNQSGHV